MHKGLRVLLGERTVNLTGLPRGGTPKPGCLTAIAGHTQSNRDARDSRIHRVAAESSGFTLVELMVTIAIVGILVAISVPSFKSIIERNRIASEASSFVSDLQFTRSEAIKRGLQVSMCPSSDNLTCLTANTWQKGWIVFSDADGSGTFNNTDTVLRARKGWTSGDTFVASPSLTVLSFSRDGFAAGLPAGTVTMPLRSAPANTSTTKCVALNRVGRQVVQNPGTGACT